MEFRNKKVTSHSDMESIETASFVMLVHEDVKWREGIHFSFAFAARAHDGLQILTARACDGFVISVELAHVFTLVFVIGSQHQGIAAVSTPKT